MVGTRVSLLVEMRRVQHRNERARAAIPLIEVIETIIHRSLRVGAFRWCTNSRAEPPAGPTGCGDRSGGGESVSARRSDSTKAPSCGASRVVARDRPLKTPIGNRSHHAEHQLSPMHPTVIESWVEKNSATSAGVSYITLRGSQITADTAAGRLMGGGLSGQRKRSSAAGQSKARTSQQFTDR